MQHILGQVSTTHNTSWIREAQHATHYGSGKHNTQHIVDQVSSTYLGTQLLRAAQTKGSNGSNTCSHKYAKGTRIDKAFVLNF